MLELADRHVWGACVFDVRVQVPFAAPNLGIFWHTFVLYCIKEIQSVIRGLQNKLLIALRTCPKCQIIFFPYPTAPHSGRVSKYHYWLYSVVCISDGEDCFAAALARPTDCWGNGVLSVHELSPDRVFEWKEKTDFGILSFRKWKAPFRRPKKLLKKAWQSIKLSCIINDRNIPLSKSPKSFFGSCDAYGAAANSAVCGGFISLWIYFSTKNCACQQVTEISAVLNKTELLFCSFWRTKCATWHTCTVYFPKKKLLTNHF